MMQYFLRHRPFSHCYDMETVRPKTSGTGSTADSTNIERRSSKKSTPPMHTLSSRRVLLSDEEKRIHHIQSEQRRRSHLKQALDILNGMIPVSDSRGSPGNLSEASIIMKGT